MKKAGIVVLISIILCSCKKDHDPVIERNKTGLLSRVLISGKPYQEYTYTSIGLISEEKSWGTYTKYTYNPTNQLIKLDFYIDPSLYSSSTAVIAEAQKRKEWANPKNVPKSITNTFFYSNDGQVVQINYENVTGYRSFSKNNLDKNGLVSKVIFYYDDQEVGYIDYFYDTQNNLIRRKHYLISADGQPKISDETEYEFDNKKNPYFPFSKLISPGRNTNRNNITKETYTLYGETPLTVEWLDITTHTYEYNDLDYPVKVDAETVYEYE